MLFRSPMPRRVLLRSLPTRRKPLHGRSPILMSRSPQPRDIPWPSSRNVPTSMLPSKSRENGFLQPGSKHGGSDLSGPLFFCFSLLTLADEYLFGLDSTVEVSPCPYRGIGSYSIDVKRPKQLSNTYSL